MYHILRGKKKILTRPLWLYFAVADTLLWKDKKQTLTAALVLAAIYFNFVASGFTVVTSISRILLVASIFLFIHGRLPQKMYSSVLSFLLPVPIFIRAADIYINWYDRITGNVNYQLWPQLPDNFSLYFFLVNWILFPFSYFFCSDDCYLDGSFL